MRATVPSLLLLLCLVRLPAPACATPSPLPQLVTVQIGARLSLSVIRVELPDGRVLSLGDQPYARVTLPPGSRVLLTEGEERNYEGLLVVERQEDGKVVAALTLDRRTYLAGVLVSEMGATAPAAALEAQAVVARTLLALPGDRHPEDPWSLCDLTHCQSFRGVTESMAARSAVTATDGRVLTVMGQVVEAPYHSTCGGQTFSSLEIWGHAVPHLCGGTDLRPDGVPYCSGSTHGPWRAVVDRADLPDPRLEPERFRTAVGRRDGWNLVKSNRFTVTVLAAAGRSQWVLEGTGLGHGVGMCQQGAIGRAAAGASAAEILVAYFPGVTPTVP